MIILDKKSAYLPLLIFFHIAFSGFLALIASSDFLSHLHNGEGFWNFAKDSTLYHKEAIIQLQYLKDSDWVRWFLSFPNHQNVKLISLSYWVSGYSIPFSYALVNAVIWLLSVILIFKSSKLLFPMYRFLPLFTIIFFLQPSILGTSTQLLRDPIFILGLCSFIYGWTILEKCQVRWQWFFYILCGFILTVSMRPYLFQVFAFSSIVYLIWVVYKKRWMMFPAVLLVLLLALYNLNYTNTRAEINVLEKDVKQNEIINFEYQADRQQQKFSKERASLEQQLSLLEKQGLSEQQKVLAAEKQLSLLEKQALLVKQLALLEKLEINYRAQALIERQVIEERENSSSFKLLDNISRHIGRMRFDFVNADYYSGSQIDFEKHIGNFYDALEYFPRAVQIGFLAPFPSDWLREGKEVGKIGLLLAGFEMILWYIILVGSFYIFFTHRSIMRPLIPVFIFSLTIIILLGYVLPNVGAIFRMRQAYMIPFYIFGLYGVMMLYEKWSQRNLP